MVVCCYEWSTGVRPCSLPPKWAYARSLLNRRRGPGRQEYACGNRNEHISGNFQAFHKNPAEYHILLPVVDERVKERAENKLDVGVATDNRQAISMTNILFSVKDPKLRRNTYLHSGLRRVN